MKDLKNSNSKFRFYKRNNIQYLCNIQKSQFAEYIGLYGIEIDYFSRNLDYFTEDGKGINPNTYDYTVWSGPETAKFGLKIPIVCVIDYGSDSFMFSSFGADMLSEGTFYITKEQFQIDCMQYGGCSATEENIDVWYDIECSNFKVLPYSKNIMSINKEYEIVIEEPNEIDATYIENGSEYDDFDNKYDLKRATNSDVIGHIYYENDNAFISETIPLSATISKDLDNKGNGVIKVHIVGKVAYNNFKILDNARNATYKSILLDSKNENIPITYKPKTGDFVRLYMLDDHNCFRDYEITQVVDADLSDDGISPYITSFLWKCSFVRRNASNEQFEAHITDKPQESEIETNEMKENDASLQDETAEDNAYDYGKLEIEDNSAIFSQIDTGLDRVYGGYGRSKKK